MKLINVLVVAAASLFSQLALAGAVIEVPVEIDAEARMAFGNLKTARFSANEQEQIGCGTRANTLSGSLFEWGFCQARLDDDTTAFCTTDNPELVDRIRGMSDYSYVIFRWDEEGNCTYFGSSIQSQYIPQYLDKKAK